MPAENVDGQGVVDARYFELQPGAHDLKVRIEQQGYADADQRFTGDIRSRHCSTLQETSHGPYVDALPKNAQSRTLAQTTNLDCMPGLSS